MESREHHGYPAACIWNSQLQGVIIYDTNFRPVILNMWWRQTSSPLLVLKACETCIYKAVFELASRKIDKIEVMMKGRLFRRLLRKNTIPAEHADDIGAGLRPGNSYVESKSNEQAVQGA
jgi:hypothetical protein